jgi:AraC family transcriptional regulator
MLRELNRAVGYIESRLTESITLEEISRFAGVSDYHFRKVFFYLSGLTLSEYIKNRRLAEANKALQGGGRVTDVAYQYGYESLDGFSRAFKAFCGILPSEVVKTGLCRSFPPLSFAIDVKGGYSMHYKIVEMPAFWLAGVSRRVPMQFEGVNNAIVELAKSITPAQREAMHTLQDLDPREVVNASYEHDYDFTKDAGDLTHMIGVLTTQKPAGDLLDAMEVAAGTWAVFPNEGPFPQTLQQTYADTYAQWLPASDYEVIKAPGFSFTKMDKEKPNHAYSEIWMPVRKKGG